MLSLCAAQLQAQSYESYEIDWPPHSLSELPYKPWAAFAGDTARYLEFNYNIRGVRYAGWTVGEILEELELPMIGICWLARSIPYTRQTFLGGLYLIIRQKGDRFSELRDDYIIVRFENAPYFEEFRRVSPMDNRTLTPELYNFIRDLRVSNVSTNPVHMRDPELIERHRRLIRR